MADIEDNIMRLDKILDIYIRERLSLKYEKAKRILSESSSK